MTAPAPMTPWLTLVGIGEDGRDGLTPRAVSALDGAELVVGGKRHLALAAPLAGEILAWPSPIEGVLPALMARRGRPVVVLATGDPFHYGIGTTMAAHVARSEIVSLPQPSAFSLAASLLCWSLQDVALVSMHGRDARMFLRHVRPGARILVLSWDGTTPAKIARLLCERGFGGSRMTVLEAMGGPRERMREVIADGFGFEVIDSLNTVAIECSAMGAAEGLFLPDEAFEHDGQITKRDVRALTLAALEPRPGALLWDVGAGSGSVSIQWMRLDPSYRAVAIEARPERAARIGRNAARLGADSLAVVEGHAPDALAGLSAPHAVFVGGGAEPAVLDRAMEALNPGGKLVVNAVTLETQALLAERHATQGGELILLQVAEASPLGRYRGWRPAMPITQWRWRKP